MVYVYLGIKDSVYSCPFLLVTDAVLTLALDVLQLLLCAAYVIWVYLLRSLLTSYF
jgi:hypothetical protein